MKVGDGLYAVDTYNENGYDAKVVKIGRKYIYVDILNQEVPFDIKTRRQKNTGFGYGYRWVLYDSEEVYKNIIEFNQKWNECISHIDSLSRLGKQKIIEIYEAEKH